MNYYYSLLSATEKRAYQEIVQAIACRQRTVRLKITINENNLSSVLQAVNYDHPEFYYVDFHCNPYQIHGFELVLELQYLYAERVLADVQADIECKIQTALKEIVGNGTFSPYQHIRRIHNYIVKHVKYDYEALQTPNMHPDAYNIAMLTNQYMIQPMLSNLLLKLLNRTNLLHRISWVHFMKWEQVWLLIRRKRFSGLIKQQSKDTNLLI